MPKYGWHVSARVEFDDAMPAVVVDTEFEAMPEDVGDHLDELDLPDPGDYRHARDHVVRMELTIQRGPIRQRRVPKRRT